MHYLALHGFTGEIVPLNPRREVVQGRKCYAAHRRRAADRRRGDRGAGSLGAADWSASAPMPASAAASSSPRASRRPATRRAPRRKRRSTRISAETGMRLVGPNCLGLINFRNGMALTSARVLDVEKIIPGHVGLLSQSGALMLSVYNRAHDQGIGFSQLVSVGNQADLDICDFFEHMIEDPVTTVICLHIEGFKDGRRAARAARARTRRASPSSCSRPAAAPQGEAAARSHTASLAGAYPRLRSRLPRRRRDPRRRSRRDGARSPISSCAPGRAAATASASSPPRAA